MSNKDNHHIVDTNKKISSVDWLAEKFNHVNWLRNRDEISAGMADEWRKHYLEQAKAMHKEETVEFTFNYFFENQNGEDIGEYYQKTYGE